MKTDKDALYAGIDTRASVLVGMNQLLEAFEELGVERAASQIETVRNTCLILGESTPDMPRPRVDETRARLVEMRDGLLSATKFEWSVLCSHAIWWLSVILEG